MFLVVYNHLYRELSVQDEDEERENPELVNMLYVYKSYSLVSDY